MRKGLCAVLGALVAFAGVDSATCAQTTAVGGAAPPALRIPDGARPLRYEATLTVVPGEAKAAGEITIDVAMTRPHDTLWLNAEALSVSRAQVERNETRVTIVAGGDQFVGLAFDPPLPSGLHRLTLTFEAEQSRNTTTGVFALQDGGDWYAMTQFEPTRARRAFPCFDEPGFKAPWRLWLRVPRSLVALSNTPAVSETDVGDGMKLVRFAETRPLPSYLVAFAVGPWQTVDLGPVGRQPTPMRIVVPKGRATEVAFAARAYPQLFEQMERWFDIVHPYPKLDHIAIPLTVNFAMENAGLITYGAPNLLTKSDPADARFRLRAANLGAHEMAHQWFGNLVTPAWWDDIWLNEAFATWFAEKMVDRWRPEYQRGAGRIHARAEAIAEDALSSARKIREPIVSRGDIFNAFDSITYEKGATVIGMFEGWISEEPFQRGVRRYLESHRDGNATADDFLNALSAASGRTVAPAFSSFLDQNGVPQVDVRLRCDKRGAKLEVSQRRLSQLGATAGADQRWRIPVCMRYGTGKTSQQACALVTEKSETLSLKGACPAFVFANAGGRGYYVPDHQGDLLARLAAHRNALSAAEYASLLYDLRALVIAGSVNGAQALEWVRAAGPSRDRHVMEAAIELVAFVRDTLVGDAERARFSAFVRQVFGSHAKALGFAPKSGESDDDQLMRRSLIRVVAAEDPQLAAEARKLALAWVGDRRAIDPGLADSVLLVAGRTGDAVVFDAMVAEAKATPDRLDRRNLMVALFSFSDPELARRGLGLLLDQGMDIRELTTALWISSRSNPPRRETHEFIVANFDELAKRVSPDVPAWWPSYAAGLCSEKDREEVEAFWRERVRNYPGSERNLAQAVEAIDLCRRLREGHGKAVTGFLGKL
jgi:aminopeptidase N